MHTDSYTQEQEEPVFTSPSTQPVMHRPMMTTTEHLEFDNTLQHRPSRVSLNVPSQPATAHVGPVIGDKVDATKRNSMSYPDKWNASSYNRMSVTSYQELPRQYNTGPELDRMVAHLGVKKSRHSVGKAIYLGFLAALWVVLAGMFSLILAGGIPPEVRKQWPVLPKLLIAVTFPVGLVYILVFGGDLFTGNTMVMAVAFLNKKVSLKELSINWLIAFTSNFVFCMLLTYIFAYIPGIYEQEPFNSFIKGLAEKKAKLYFYQAFIMGIPANTLVCLAVFLGLAARDVTGKILAMYMPIATFAATGWEHCVANMFYLSLGYFYGADMTFGDLCANVFTVAMGNIVGGAIVIGGSEYYLYHWHRDREPTKHSEH